MFWSILKRPEIIKNKLSKIKTYRKCLKYTFLSSLRKDRRKEYNWWIKSIQKIKKEEKLNKVDDYNSFFDEV